VAGTEATLADLLALLNGEVDPQRVFTLARPLMALDWPALKQHVRTRGPLLASADETAHHADADGPHRAEPGQMPVLGLLKLCHYWGQLKLHAGSSPVSVRLDPKIFSRLTAGELAKATRLAKRRLRVDGLTPRVGEALDDPPLARQMAAALAVPLAANDAARLARTLTSEAKQGNDHAAEATDATSTFEASV
jgi:CRISPR-associated protein Csx17